MQLEYGVRIEVQSLRTGEFSARRERGDPFVRTVVEEGDRGLLGETTAFLGAMREVAATDATGE